MSRSWRDNIIRGQEELTGFLGAKVTFMHEATNSNGTCCTRTAPVSAALKFYYQNIFQCNL